MTAQEFTIESMRNRNITGVSLTFHHSETPSVTVQDDRYPNLNQTISQYCLGQAIRNVPRGLGEKRAYRRFWSEVEKRDRVSPSDYGTHQAAIFDAVYGGEL